MTKSTETEIAILQTQMIDVKVSLAKIEADQKTNFDAVLARIDGLSSTPQKIIDMNTRIAKLEKAQGRNWIWQTLSAGAGALFFFLVQYTLTH